MKLISILLAVTLASCANLQPPLITDKGDVLFPITRDGVTYYAGTTQSGDKLFQWTQSDDSKVRAILKDNGVVDFYINRGQGFVKVGAKETVTVPFSMEA